MSQNTHEPITLPEMFARTVSRYGDREALRSKEGGAYQSISYAGLSERVGHLAAALSGLGIRQGDRICLLSENRPEWVITDLGVLSLGAVLVPIYPTLPPAQVEYILRDSGAAAIVVSDAKQLEKVLAVRERASALRHVIAAEPPAELPEGVLPFAKLLRQGTAAGQPPPAAIQPSDLASIVYTSGTTGDPKGAMLSHGNFTSDAQATLRRFRLEPEDLVLSYIPLSHIFSRLVNYAVLGAGAATAFAQSIFTVSTNLAEVRPTLLPTVPRLLESIQARAISAAARGGAPGDLGAVFGGRLRCIISGGGPLAPETARFYSHAGLTIIEGYGLTETAGVVAGPPVGKPKIGTVGPPLDGIELRIAEDGEILLRGPSLMQGYYNKPDETAQAIDPDGWFHTGDIGELDEDGYLKITDRKKDLIVLSNGKKVAPQAIERTLKESPYISEVALLGERQSVVGALIVPEWDHMKAWGRERGLAWENNAQLAAAPEVRELIKGEIDARSGDLADFERIRRFAVLPRDFSPQHDELTPTLKLKRRVAAKNFEDTINSLFRGGKE